MSSVNFSIILVTPFLYSMCKFRFLRGALYIRTLLSIILMREDESTALKCFSWLNSLILDRENQFFHQINVHCTVGDMCIV